MEGYKNFNIGQIIPVFNELNIGEKIIEEIIKVMNDLKYIYIDILNRSVKFTSKDINREKFIYKLKNCLSKKNKFKSLGTKETTFEKLNKGISYKYKINDKLLAENPNKIKIKNIEISIKNSIIINNNDFFIFEENINFNINNINQIIFELNKISMQIDFYKKNIKSDVIHFNLFDQKYLEL